MSMKKLILISVLVLQCAMASTSDGDGHLQKRRKGRHQNQSGQASHVGLGGSAGYKFDSEAAFYAVKSWAWGHSSAVQLQETMQHNFNDQVRLLRNLGLNTDLCCQSLKDLSKLGAHGRHPGNIKRDLVGLLGAPQVPEAYVIQAEMAIPKLNGPGNHTQVMDFPILLPHEVFAHLHQAHPTRFGQLFLDSGNCKTLEDFWGTAMQRKDPRLRYHPMVKKTGWMSNTIPISVHGDGVACTAVGKPGSKSFEAYSWQGLMSNGNSKEAKLYILGLFESCKTENTMHAAWEVVMWSFHWLFEGKWPDRDHTGAIYRKGTMEARRALTLLAVGKIGVIWSLKADLDHLNKAYGLRRFNSDTPCEFCPANRSGTSDMWYSNFRQDAAWKKMLYTQEQWQGLREEAHPLFKVPYISLHNIEIDELHVIHLGTSQCFLGSILWLLCYQVLPGPPDINMEQVWDAVSKCYADMRVDCQFSNLTLGSFCNPLRPIDSYPRLKGKGAEIKCLVGPLLHVYSGHTRHGNRIDTLVVAALRNQYDLQRTLSDNAYEPFLPEADALLVMERVEDFLRDYSLLANAADEGGLLLFNVVPKHHWLWHFGYKAWFLNPRKGNCCLDEDYVGVVKDIVQSCTHGTPVQKTPCSVMEKLRWGQHFLCVYGDRFADP